MDAPYGRPWYMRDESEPDESELDPPRSHFDLVHFSRRPVALALAHEAMYEAYTQYVYHFVPALFPDLASEDLADWERYGLRRTKAWWRESACPAILRKGVPLDIVPALRALLVPDERALSRFGSAVCPLPDVDLVKEVFQEAASQFAYFRDDDLAWLVDRVLGVPRLTYWARHGHASEVLNVLEDRDEFRINTRAHRVKKFERWNAERGAAAIAAHRLVAGDISLEAFASEIGAQGELTGVALEEVMIACPPGCNKAPAHERELEAFENSWLAFYSSPQRDQWWLEPKSGLRTLRKQQRERRRRQQAPAQAAAWTLPRGFRRRM